MNKDRTKISEKLTVLYEDPFWIGIFERIWEGQMSVCKVTFGGEPKDYEIQEFVLKKYEQLRFSPSVALDQTVKEHRNPKRMQRDIKKQVQESGIGTKSQQALKLQQEQSKIERKVRSKAQRAEEKERQFQLKQQKRKEKHKGR